MRNKIGAALAVLVIALSMGLFGCQHRVMSIVGQNGSPASLISTTHTSADYLASGELHNSSSQPIVEYRIGWVSVVAPGKSVVSVGEAMNVPSGIAPESTTVIPAQSVIAESVGRDVRCLAFFVAEVKFANG